MLDHHHIEIDRNPRPLVWSDSSCLFFSQPSVPYGAGLLVPLVPPLTWPAALFDDAAEVEGPEGLLQ